MKERLKKKWWERDHDFERRGMENDYQNMVRSYKKSRVCIEFVTWK